jgi:NADPH-dependent curcumin reductase CurA
MSAIKEIVKSVPSTFQKWVVHTLHNDFEKATCLETVEFQTLVQALKPNQVIVKYAYAGINASDINYTAGRYDPSLKPPFDCGFEAIGTVIATGTKTKVKLLQPVAVMTYGAFSEYQIIPERVLIPIPALDKQFLALIVSGMTSELALKYHGQMKGKETVLVTAAAGGAGQIAVQLAKANGNHVIGTCSTGKEEFLKSLGVDRVINYKTENLLSVLKTEYPRGVDIIYESVGGQMFQDCVKSLALKGRLIVIGSVSNYATKVEKGEAMNKFNGWDSVNSNALLGKSSTITGFFLNHYVEEFPSSMKRLTDMVSSGKLKPMVHDEAFIGIASIPAAIKCMHSGRNKGKLVVALDAAKSKL